jgi:TetR/AcrR family transcriptional regulator, transcriptional repressor of bet genes
MARVPVRAIRRMEMEKAAYDAINDLGLHGFALAAIARHAGTAKGDIHHYFLNKEELIEGAARHANREFSQAALRIIKAAKSPRERIWAIIVLNVDAEFFQPHLVRAYLFVLTSGIRYKGVLRICDAAHARTISNLAFALRQLVKPEDVQPIANAIWTMIEGAWIFQANHDINIAKPTLRILADYLKKAVSGFDSSVVQTADFSRGRSQSHP